MCSRPADRLSVSKTVFAIIIIKRDYVEDYKQCPYKFKGVWDTKKWRKSHS